MACMLVVCFLIFAATVNCASLSGIESYLSGIFNADQIRVIGGKNALPGQFPYQVLIKITRQGQAFLCGGSLISDRHVLTAAHCVQGSDYVLLTFGSISTSTVAGTETKLVYNKNIKVHPDWDSDNIKNDVALIFLDSPIKVSNLANPLQLPNSDIDEGSGLYLSGWGKTSDKTNHASSLLKYAQLDIMPLPECKFYYSMLGMQIDESQICTNHKGKNACNGDSGGPLAMKTASGTVEIGLVSFGLASCEMRFPDVYTRVSYFVPWIKKMTGIK